MQSISSKFKFVSYGDLSGWVGTDLPSDQVEEMVKDPELLFRDPSSLVMKRGRRTTVIKQTLNGRNVVIKRFHYASASRRLAAYVLPCPAISALEGALVLQKEGIPTAVPLGALYHQVWSLKGTSYYFSEEILDACSLRILWRDRLPLLPTDRTLAEQILKDVAGLFYRLHSRGVYHRDLKAGNIVLQHTDEGNRYFLVDAEATDKWTHLSWRRRTKNLLQLYRTLGLHLSSRERDLFLQEYAKLCGLTEPKLRALASRLLLSKSLY